MVQPIALLVLAVPALLAQAPSVPQRPLEDLLPAGSYAAARFAGLAECARATDDMAVAALVRTFLKRVPRETYDQHVGAELDRMASELRRELQREGIAPADLRNVLRRPMALGMGRITLRGMGPSVALLIDEGDAGPSIDKLTAAFEQVLRHEMRGLQESRFGIRSRDFRLLSSSEGPEILIGRDAGVFFVSNSRGYLGDILAAADGEVASLAASSTLGSQRQRLGAPAVMSVFVNTQPVLGTFSAHMPYEAGELAAAFGLETVAGIYAGAGVSQGMTVETFDVAAPGSAQGLLKAAVAGKADLRAAALCSDETLAFGSLRCDVMAFVGALERAADLLPAELSQEARREFVRELRNGLREIGLTPQQLEQLLRSVDGSLSFAVGVAKGPVPVPELTVFVPVRDEQVVATWLERLAGMAEQETGMQWKTRKSGDAEIRYCEVQAGPFALSPSFVLANGHLIIGSSTKSVLRTLNQDRATSLAASEDFAAAAKQCQGAAAMLHLRTFRLVEIGWRDFETHVLGMVDAHSDELGFDREAVPDQEDFARGLGTMTWSASVDEQGLHLDARGSLGQSTLLIAAGALFDELLLRASGRVF